MNTLYYYCYVSGLVLLGFAGNRPLEPQAREVEFFPMEEVLHEEVKIHRQPDHGRAQAR
jgi:hypothetical protein